MRKPAIYCRPDANHQDAIGWYEALFCTVIDLSKVGGGCGDLLIGCTGGWHMVEVKSADGELSASQLRFQRESRGGKVTVVRTQANAISHVQAIRERAAGIRRQPNPA